ncbi:Hypothetical predicted protein [Paramuricea clavata]|uniref:Uncharacterized protein n=1 Tax=Paramuricea clavata TaxID=317549 RepID=A0A7D9I663_PARCT|nr:Hypothetical predicted protein [Paramuricea clavata]
MNEVRKLMGFLNYYRRYIANFSRIAKPIYDLVKVSENDSKTKRGKPMANNPVSWTPAHQSLLEELIGCLVSAPVMAYPDPHSPYVLHTDASENGLGVVLYQEQDDGLRVIAYGSRTLTPAEKNYHLHSVRYRPGKLNTDADTLSRLLEHMSKYMDSCTEETCQDELRAIVQSIQLEDKGKVTWVSSLIHDPTVLHGGDPQPIASSTPQFNLSDIR